MISGFGIHHRKLTVYGVAARRKSGEIVAGEQVSLFHDFVCSCVSDGVKKLIRAV